MRDTIGKRIKMYREKEELSQTELAEKVGVRYQSVQQWEADETAPRRDRIRKLAAALRVTEPEIEFGAKPVAKTAPGLPDEMVQIAIAFGRLSEAQKAYYKEAIFRDAAISTVMPWFRTGRPSNGDYDIFERRVEVDFEKRVRQLKLELDQ